MIFNWNKCVPLEKWSEMKIIQKFILRLSLITLKFFPFRFTAVLLSFWPFALNWSTEEKEFHLEKVYVCSWGWGCGWLWSERIVSWNIQVDTAGTQYSLLTHSHTVRWIDVIISVSSCSARSFVFYAIKLNWNHKNKNI